MKRKGLVYSGTSNVVIPLKQSQFPAEYAGASRLSYYASLFSSVEVNATFYKLPKAATLEKWANSVPDNFQFTFKVPKGITHTKGFRFSFEEIELFVETVSSVGDKKGCLLLQLPPKVTIDKEEELGSILESLSDNAKGWKIAVEFRHPSWYERSTYHLLQGYKAVMVEHDMPKSATPGIELDEKFIYLRFHGPEDRYRGSYDDDFLKAHAKRIQEWIKDGKEVYVYFNNTMGDALGNLQTLNRMTRN